MLDKRKLAIENGRTLAMALTGPRADQGIYIKS